MKKIADVFGVCDKTLTNVLCLKIGREVDIWFEGNQAAIREPVEMVRFVCTAVCLLVGCVDTAAKEWNYVGQWRGDQTFDVDTRESPYRYLVAGLTQSPLVVKGVSVVVTEGRCDIDIEYGGAIHKPGVGKHIDDLVTASRSPQGLPDFIVVGPTKRLLKEEPRLLHIFRTDNSDSPCKFRIYLRYRTLSHAILKQKILKGAEFGLRRFVEGKVNSNSTLGDPTVFAISELWRALSSYMQAGGWRDDDKVRRLIESETKGSVPTLRQAVLSAIAKNINEEERKKLLWVVVALAVAEDVFWELFNDPLTYLVSSGRD